MQFKFDELKCSDISMIIRIWPDNTWAIVEDIQEGEFNHKSDDYQDVDIYDFEAWNKLDPALSKEITEEVMGPDPYEIPNL